MRLFRLAQTLPAINWLQTVGSLERQHPPWILRGKSADFIQLPKLVLGECEFDRRKVVLKLVQAFRANDDRGYHRLGSGHDRSSSIDRSLLPVADQHIAAGG